MQERLEAAAVEMSPGALLIVIVKPDALLAGRARPVLRLVMLGPHVHPLLLHVELDAVDGPWLLEAQQLPVQIGVTHAPSVALSRAASCTSRPPRRPTRFPEVPAKKAPTPHEFKLDPNDVLSSRKTFYHEPLGKSGAEIGGVSSTNAIHGDGHTWFLLAGASSLLCTCSSQMFVSAAWTPFFRDARRDGTVDACRQPRDQLADDCSGGGGIVIQPISISS